MIEVNKRAQVFWVPLRRTLQKQIGRPQKPHYGLVQQSAGDGSLHRYFDLRTFFCKSERETTLKTLRYSRKGLKWVRERDKLPVRRINWQDPELLRRVVEERFVKSGADVARPSDIWSRYFPASIESIPIRNYLVSATLPRPRDLIFLVKAALECAVNRGHGQIEEADLRSAQLEYSRFALNSVVAEAAPRVPEIDDLLLEFARAGEIVDREDIKVAMRRAGLNEIRFTEIVDLLTELTFLGPETSPDRFDFINDEDSLMKTRVMARNFSEEVGQQTRYRINPPFHAFLEIAPKRALAPGQLQIELSSDL